MEVSPSLASALRTAQRGGMVMRGLEGAARTLAAEEQGLRMSDRQSPVKRGARVSRLLLLADDGSERFYRHVEALVRLYGARILVIRLRADALTLGELLFGAGHPVRLLMIGRKEAVCSVLLSLAE